MGTEMSQLKLSILNRQSIALGRSFDNVGAYERIDARAEISVDPSEAADPRIVDLEFATRGKDGRVHFTTDVQILKPVDMAKSNRRLFVELVNRGNKRCLQFFNDAPGTNDPRTLSDCGNGFLMRRGYTVCWIAWQGDILPGNDRILLDLPVAADGDAPITGPVRSEFIATKPNVYDYPLSGWISTRSHPTVSRDTSKATLTRRRYPEDTPETIPSNAWQFARLAGGSGLDNQGTEYAVVPSDTDIYLPAGL